MDTDNLKYLNEYWERFDQEYAFVTYFNFSKVPYETLLAIDMDDTLDDLVYFTFDAYDRLGFNYTIRLKDEDKDVDPYLITVEMLTLSKYGIKGEIELSTHDHHAWFIVADGKGSVKIYEGRFMYPDEPTIVVGEHD